MPKQISSFQLLLVFSLSSVFVPILANFAHSSQTIVWANPTIKELIYKENCLPSLKIAPNEKPIHNCNSLVRAINSGVDLGETKERKEFNSYWKCLVRAVAERGIAAERSRFDLSKAGTQIFQRLDLASVRSSLAPRRPSTHYYLRDFIFASKQMNATSLTLDTAPPGEDGFYYNFEILATGDFLRDGMLDLLVTFTDDATLGTYHSVQVLILSWPYDKESITAVEAIQFLQLELNYDETKRN
ncbi:hypothetical protein SAMN04488082_12363 [Desulfomicrobium apsheronum]|uniref:Uncharacterized protein n=1 Tax=Desulfomicrobium apsheronum TaxID=52560 RepID=A0A1I3ZEA9_9BACT|nr:hypothetical protein [Desulfomicrobium apsheronum]SFK42230.1 hypothetical protein SAMN04488082_12363 [Desulfomicrobium apsheronum]